MFIVLLYTYNKSNIIESQQRDIDVDHGRVGGQIHHQFRVPYKPHFLEILTFSILLIYKFWGFGTLLNGQTQRMLDSS